MINSLFMLGSSYNRNRKISLAFIIGWIAYMLLGSNLSLGATFPIVNAVVFLVVSILINLVKNKKANMILSMCSILIWSIIIDTICYFMYPAFTGGQRIFGYIFQGILFNYKYIFSNIIAMCLINAVDYMMNKVSAIVKSRKDVVA